MCHLSFTVPSGFFCAIWSFLFFFWQNQGSCLNQRNLNYGRSESRSDRRLIGKFGDGLVAFILVLTVNQHEVEISTGSHNWKFFLGKIDDYPSNNLFLSSADRKATKPNFSTKVTVQNLSAEYFDITHFLNQIPYSKKVEKSICDSGCLNEYPNDFKELKGHRKPDKLNTHLFIKGILAQDDPRLNVSINLLKCETNRDRKYPNDYSELVRFLCHIWENVIQP